MASDMAAEYRTRPISADEYHRMGEFGIFDPGERIELLDGELIAMPPIGPDHAFSVLALTELLVLRFHDRASISVQNSFALDLHSEPEPDVVVLAPPRDRYRGRLPAPADAMLIIEVSNSSWTYDRGSKYRAFARAGIPEFWIVYLAERRVFQYRDPHGETYRFERSFAAGERLAAEAFPNDLISVDDILP